jgi:hypothetical protein
MPKQINEDLSPLSFKSEISPNMDTILYNMPASSFPQIWTVLPAYCRIGAKVQEFVIEYPFTTPAMDNLQANLARVSTAKLKIKGARGEPCRTPHCGWIQLPHGFPLINGEKDVVVMHLFIL